MAEQERLDRGERSDEGRREGHRDGARDGSREGGRRSGGADRDGAGLRIRLSDNELRAARTIQDAFQLRSTVAVMGFCLRTMAQLLEQGALEGVTVQQRAGGRTAERGERGDRGERRGGGAPAGRGPRPDPFARPSRPAAPVVAEPEADGIPEATDGTGDSAAPDDTEVMVEVEATAAMEGSEAADPVTAESTPAEAGTTAEEPAEEPTEV